MKITTYLVAIYDTLSRPFTVRSNKAGIGRSEEGFVLLTAMMMMIALALLGLAATTTAVFELQIAGNERWAKEQFYRADSAVNMLLAEDIEPQKLPNEQIGPLPPGLPQSWTCADVAPDPLAHRFEPFRTLDDFLDPGVQITFFYIVNPDDIKEILVCATRGQTVASITAGIEFGLATGGIGDPSNPIGYN